MSSHRDFNDLIENIRDELPTRVHDAFNEAVERAAAGGRHSSRKVAREMKQRDPWVRAERQRHQREEGLVAVLMLIAGFIGGAVLMYLFDPERGERRRALIGAHVDDAVSDASDSLEGKAKDVASRVQGITHDAQPGQAQDAAVSDKVLKTRVTAQLGTYVGDPGAISVTVNAGNVILSGKIRAREAQPLIERVRTISGVKNVENRLELHDSGDDVPDPQGGSNGTSAH